MYDITTALDETLLPHGIPKPIFRREPSITANHLSCHALASPWRANVSSCEERTPPTLRATSFTPSQSLAFCLAQRFTWRACWQSRPEYCLQHFCLLTHLSPKTASFVQEAGGPRLADGFLGWYAGVGTFLFLGNFVCHGLSV